MSEVTEKRGEDVRKGPAGYPLRKKKSLRVCLDIHFFKKICLSENNINYCLSTLTKAGH